LALTCQDDLALCGFPNGSSSVAWRNLHGIGSACTEPESRMTTREDPPVGADAAATSCCSAHSSVSAGCHPLDPLDGDEMAHAAKIVAAAFGKDEPIRFQRLEIEEPQETG